MKRGKLFFLFLFSFFLIKNNTYSSIQCGSFDECFDFGMQTFDSENYDASIYFFKRALTEWNDFNGRENYKATKENISAAYNNRGLQKLNKGKVGSAIMDFTASAKVLPGYVLAYFNRGLAYSKKGNRKKAIENYTKVVKLEPKAALAYYHRGVQYYYSGKYHKAIADFTRTVKLEPSFIYGYKDRGITYIDVGKHDKAIAEFSRLLKFYPYDAGFHYYRALAYLHKNNFDTAVEGFTKAIDLDPSFGPAYFSRGLSYREKDEYGAALLDFTKIIEMMDSGEANIPAAYFQRGLTHGLMGNFDGAIQDFQQVVHMNPGFHMAYDYLGDFYFMAGDVNRAEENYKKALKGTRGKNPVPYLSIGEIEDFKGNKAGAMENYKKAERIFRKLLVKNKSADLETFMGYLLAVMEKNLNEADRRIQRAMKDYPFLEGFSRMVSGMIFHKMKRYDDALDQLGLSLRLHSPDEKLMRSIICHRLALVYRDRGDTQKAKHYAELSLSLIPTNPESRKLRDALQQAAP